MHIISIALCGALASTLLAGLALPPSKDHD
ncbi:hypothetical protein H4V96_003403 [Janthinobacterium sp. CG_23.4]|nr:hypothetical protein [Janthinobacterium sp. CG_23.4]